MATTTTVLFPWREAYSVHIEIVDSQHKVLVDTFNELHVAIVTGMSREHLGKILSSLIKYAQDHFKTEERLMFPINTLICPITRPSTSTLPRPSRSLRANS